MERFTEFSDYIYLDPDIDAGQRATGGFEPDLSFFADEKFRRLTPSERTVLYTYDMSTIYQKRFVVGFGGKHTYDHDSELFGQTGHAFNYFISLVNGEPDRAICIIEGGVRDIDPSDTDRHIFAVHGESGRAQAMAQRAGIQVVGAEPLVGLNALAKTYGSHAVLQYLSERLLPQWYDLDPAKRPPPHAYIVNVFRNRPVLSQLRHMVGVDSYVQELLICEKPFTLPYDIPMPDREECLRQTTHEYIVGIPEAKRTITQRIALEHNLQRDRRLYSDIQLYHSQGMHVGFIYGDVHVRALDKSLASTEREMRIGREAHNRFISLSG